jgi:hypothetical protein
MCLVLRIAIIFSINFPSKIVQKFSKFWAQNDVFAGVDDDVPQWCDTPDQSVDFCLYRTDGRGISPILIEDLPRIDAIPES